MIYRIYAKTKDMSRFKPLDVENGCYVNNLIHATVWGSETDCNFVLHDLIKTYPEIQFKKNKTK